MRKIGSLDENQSIPSIDCKFLWEYDVAAVCKDGIEAFNIYLWMDTRILS